MSIKYCKPNPTHIFAIIDSIIIVYNIFIAIWQYIKLCLLLTILLIEPRLYMCPRYRKGIKSTNCLTKYVNAYKILMTMPSYQLSKSTATLEDNMTYCPDLQLDEKGISPRASNHGKEGIWLAGNNNDNIRPANI